jgi:hypothetical protein
MKTKLGDIKINLNKSDKPYKIRFILLRKSNACFVAIDSTDGELTS